MIERTKIGKNIFDLAENHLEMRDKVNLGATGTIVAYPQPVVYNEISHE